LQPISITQILHTENHNKLMTRIITPTDDAIETEINEFDVPVPGQSLTDTPGNYPWEHPPKMLQPEMVLDILWERLTTPEALEEIITMLDAGVPVEAIVRVITFVGFAEGEFTPDVGFLIVEPLMEMITAIGVRAKIKNLRISLSDLSNKKFKKDMAKLKYVNEEIQMKKNNSKKLPMITEQKVGLLAKPMEPQGEV